MIDYQYIEETNLMVVAIRNYLHLLSMDELLLFFCFSCDGYDFWGLILITQERAYRLCFPK